MKSRIPQLLGRTAATLTALIIAPASYGSMNDNEVFTYFAADRFEYQVRDGDDALVWDAEAWIGTDYNKLWLKAEGADESDAGLESSEIQALYSRAVAPFWDLQLGLRHDFHPSPSRSFAAIGAQGEAPYGIEVHAAAFVSEDADLSLRLELEYDLLITNRLVAQPRVELDFGFQDVPELGLGSGLTGIEAGLRLRYEIRREFAPYIGIDYERATFDSAGIARDAGEDVDNFSVVAGLRWWF